MALDYSQVERLKSYQALIEQGLEDKATQTIRVVTKKQYWVVRNLQIGLVEKRSRLLSFLPKEEIGDPVSLSNQILCP